MVLLLQVQVAMLRLKVLYASLSGTGLRDVADSCQATMIVSSAAFAGSPLTGGYAGAKRTQIFIANYSQKESASVITSKPAISYHFKTGQRITPRTR